MHSNQNVSSKNLSFIQKPNKSFTQRLAKAMVLKQFSKLTQGQLLVNENGNNYIFGSKNNDFPVSATINVLSNEMYSEIAAKGLNGAAEAFVKGLWSSNDLTRLIRIFVRNREAANQIEGGLAKLATGLFYLQHSLKRNNHKGSLRNISAHYDLGNDLFETFLDNTKMYSCAIFENENSSLEQASINKIERICKKLELSSNDHVLEIGTGWGGFAIFAAKNFGCKITTTTISQKQYEYTLEKVKALGLQDKISVLKKDYRDLTGKYNKLVSIEMIEAVGHHYYHDFFRKCNQLLTPDGRMLLQSIIITDYLYEEAKQFSDFIKTYIFPGSCIPSISKLCESSAKATDMRLFHLEDITPHYAKTLNHWRSYFMNNVQKIRDLGFSEEFIRLWNFYFCYCEGGFIERQIGAVQMLFTKPLCRMDPILPEIKLNL
jgi:cyclopropane-fatty-acyl-phospholipid synthase|tara:strand:- start:701 stop:1996 length:1296 start_codon:yes stop_codon:yes gene_type:complete